MRPDRSQIEGFDERQTETESAIGGEAIAAAPLGPKVARREAEDLFHDPVHLPNAAEPTGVGDDIHAEIRLVE